MSDFKDFEQEVRISTTIMANKKIKETIFILILGLISFALFFIELYPGSNELIEELRSEHENFYTYEIRGKINYAEENNNGCIFGLTDGKKFHYKRDLTITEEFPTSLSKNFSEGDSIIKFKGNRYFDLKSKNSGKSLRIYTE